MKTLMMSLAVAVVGMAMAASPAFASEGCCPTKKPAATTQPAKACKCEKAASCKGECAACKCAEQCEKANHCPKA